MANRNEKKEFQRFFIKACLFLLPMVLTAILVEFKLRNVINLYETKATLFKKKQSAIETLVLGNSHAYFGVSPRFFSSPQKTFNLALPSQSLAIDAQLLETYLTKMPNLKNVLISIDYLSLPHTIAGGIEHWRNHYYIRYFGLKGDGSPLDRVSIRNYSLIALYTPKLVFGFMKEQFKVNMAENLDDLGWPQGHPELGQTQLDDAAGKKRIEEHHQMMNEQNIAANVARLEAMIARLKEKKINVILFTTPVQKVYASATRKIFYSKMQESAEYLSKKYGVAYVNHFQDKDFTYQDFWDPNHLNNQGAEKFTKILNRSL